MPSTDDRIVSMKFDNRAFEQQAQTTIGTLDKLKQSLKFNNATKGITALAGAVKTITLEDLGKSVDAVANKFNVLNAVAFATIGNITNKVVNAGLQLGKSLSLEQVMTGFSEYETNINSIQTIMSNTASKGTTLQQVNDALDRLNEYSDQTIYNFGQMTKNIGTFTAAGLDLDVSVNSIKGIANIAAMSGSSAEQASTAMYQLSQALSSGTVKLMDWNSVVNAGMGGAVFKSALYETGKALGTLKGAKMDQTFEQWEDSGNNFRESLQDGWITADVLSTTLQAFTGDLNEAQLTALGYTKEQAVEMMKLGQLGKAAATNVKSLTQLLQVTKEAVGSGWSASFRTIFGDFEQAKNLFTGWYGAISKVVGTSADARNKILGDWAALGGRSELIAGITILFNDFFLAFAPIKKAFREIFPRKTGAELAALTVKFREFTEKLAMSGETADKVRRIFKGIFGLFEISFTIIRSIVGVFTNILSVFGSLSKGSTLDFFAKLGDNLLKLNNKLVRGGGIAKFFSSITEAINGLRIPLTVAVKMFKQGLNGIATSATMASSPVNKAFNSIGIAVAKMVAFFKEFGPKVWGLLVQGFKLIYGLIVNIVKIGGLIIAVFAGMAAAILSVGKVVSGYVVIGLQKLQKVFGSIVKMGESFIDAFGKDKSEGASGAINNVGQSANAAVKNFGMFAFVIKSVKEGLITFGKVAVTIFQKIGSGLATMFNSETFGNILETVRTGLFAALILMFRKFMKGGGLLDIFGGEGFSKSIQGMFNGVSNVLVGVKDVLKDLQLTIKADAIMRIAKALALLTLSIVVLSFLDAGTIYTNLSALTVGLGALTAVITALTKIKLGPTQFKDIVALSAGMVFIAGAALILSFAIKSLANLGLWEMIKGIIAIEFILRSLGEFVAQIDEGHYFKAGLMLFGLATAIKKLANVIKMLGELPLLTLTKGLVAFTVIMNRLTWLVQKLPKDSDAKLKGLFLFSVGMWVLSKAIENLGNMDIWSLTKGLLAFTIILGGIVYATQQINPGNIDKLSGVLLALSVAIGAIAISLKIISDIGFWSLMGSVLGLALTLGVLTIALYALEGTGVGVGLLPLISAGILGLAFALKMISLLSLGDIGKGLLAIAGVLAIIAIAAAVIGPIAPALIALGIGLAFVGAGFALIGLGAWLLSEALVSIAKNGDRALEAFENFLVRVIKLVPKLVSAFVNGLVEGFMSSIEAIVKAAPSLITKLTAIIIQLLKAIRKILPELMKTLGVFIDGVLDLFTDKAPDFITAGFKFLLNLLNGLLDNIDKITDTVAKIIEGFLSGITSHIPEIARRGAELLVEFLSGIEDNIGDVVDAVVSLVVTFIDSVSDNLDDIITAGVNFITSFIDGIAENVDDVVDAVVDLITAFLKAVTNRIDDVAQAGTDLIVAFIKAAQESLTDVIKAGTDFVVALIEGIDSATEAIITAVTNLIVSFIETIDTSSEAIITAGTNLIVSLIEGIDSTSEQILTAATNFVVSLMNGIAGNTSILVTTAVTIIINFIGELGKNSDKLVEAGTNLIVTLMGSLAQNLDPITKAAIELVRSFMRQLNMASEIPAIIADGVFDFFIDICNTLANTIRTRSSELWQAIDNLTDAIIEGFTEGLESRAGEALGVVADVLGFSPIRALRFAWSWWSPSRITRNLGKDVVKGFVQGVDGKARLASESMTNMATSSKTALSKALENLPDFSTFAEVTPTITPVLDLTNVQKEATRLNGFLSTAPITADISSRQASALVAVTQPQQDLANQSSGSVTEIKFEQNVYSPTALSVVDIYRQTKSQITLAKEELSIL